MRSAPFPLLVRELAPAFPFGPDSIPWSPNLALSSPLLNPLDATLPNLPVSVANKQLTQYVSPLDATLTKNRGGGLGYG
jgi:hypothetical protein